MDGWTDDGGGGGRNYPAVGQDRRNKLNISVFSLWTIKSSQ